IGEHRATARHPGNTAIVHFFAGRDVPGSAWEGRAPAPPGSSAPALRHSHPASTFSHPGRVLLPRQVPVGAPPSVRTGASTYSHPGRVLLPRFRPCRSTALGANRGKHVVRTRGGCSYPDSAPVGAPPSVRTWASTYSHPAVSLP